MSFSGVNENFILCTHPLPSTSSSTLLPPIVSTIAYSNPQANKQDPRLCVVAGGIGLGVYNLADQTPLSSLTLGPSFKPTSLAVARTTPSSSTTSIRVKGLRKTWVGSDAGQTGEIWSWSEEERKDGSIEGVASKVVYPTKSTVVAISAPKSLPEQLLLLSNDGTLALVSEIDLTPILSLPSTSTASPITQTFKVHHAISTFSFLPASILSLIPNPTRAHVIFIVRTFAPRASSASLVEIGKKSFKKTKRPSSAAVIDAAEVEIAQGGTTTTGESSSEIEIILVDPEVKEESGEKSAKIISLGKVVVSGTQVGVSENGYVSAIAANGSLQSYQLVLAGATQSPTEYSDVFSPTSPESSPSLSLTSIKSLPISKSTLSPHNTTILPLHSSFLLLVSIRPSTKVSPTSEEPPTRIVVLIWDIRLGAVVSESEISVPVAALPTTSSSTTILSLTLSYLSRQTASLVVTPTSGTTGRSVIFILPLTLPSTSNLAAVVGKHVITRKYLEVTETVLEKAKRTELFTHPRTSPAKLELNEKSIVARTQCLESLVQVLGLGTGERGNKEVALGDEVFEKFLEEERERLKVYNQKKLESANAKEKERRIAAIEEKERVQITGQKYRSAKRKIELAIKEAGKKAIWSDVTAKRIKNVSDLYRYKYYEVRKATEVVLGAVVVDKALERALKSAERQEPTLPSTFITALLRICFPGGLDSEAEITASPTAASTLKVYRHPTGMLSYLLERNLVGDGLLDGGVTRYLARAGDWPNVHRALKTMPDILESTTVALLKVVVSHHSASESTRTSIESDSESHSLPKPIPALHTFLTSFVESPTTPSILREAIKNQLTAVEVLPVLEVLDGWLGWWAARGGGGGSAEKVEDWKAEGGNKPKRLPTNPFIIVEASDEEESSPPGVEEILPLVQAILDSHFVTLLLQRQSHILLRRLSAHIATHVALSNDLSTLIGALSIYARAKEDQLELAKANKSKKLAGGESKAEKRMGGASSVARVAAQEKHAEVGEYVVDKFWL